MLHAWVHEAAGPGSAIVLPDGCRDVIVVQDAPDRPARLVLTDLDHRARRVQLAAGVRMTGYRMRPGAWLPVERLRQADPVATPIDDLTELDAELCAVIDALACPGATVAQVARRAGVSVRSLQRRFRALGQPVPEFWRGLGRARAIAPALAGQAPLAEIAADGGYADQAHMTRDVTRWFGHSPGRLRRDPGLLALLAQPGLGGWTGEQISIR